MRRNSVGIARLCMYAALAATAAVSLGGCSGGLSSADNGPGAPAAAPAPPGATTGPTTAAGTALLAAAAAAPAATNTADNPSQAFGLVNGAGLPVVAVNSPPVVNFSVIDASGKHVPGLTLFNASGATVDPNCSGNNVTLAIAKWDTSVYPQGVWQNLISRQRYATSTTNKNSVAEGTTDPKPSATKSNPATVSMTVDAASGKATVADQANQIVGILQENATEGYYTYTFAMDVVTPLLWADAASGKNVAASKIANNGNVVGKDGATIHRLGMQLCYTDPATKAKVVVNPYVDFTLAADGTATPLTVSATDKTLKPYRKVVDKASCNDCHKTLTAHGTRVDPNYCVMCHNPGSTDFDSNNPIDLKVMVHKFHRGEFLTADYRVREVVAKDTTTGKGIIYPQDVRNCVKCHGGPTSTARHPTADGDNWKNKPSRNACGACHDGVNFDSGTGTGIKGVAFTHLAGPQFADDGCAICHTPTLIASKHTLPSAADASQRTMSATITAAAVDANGKVTVTFTMTKAGVPVTSSADFQIAEMTLAKLVAGTSGSPSHWQSYTTRFRTKDAAKVPVIQGYSEGGTTSNTLTKGTLTGGTGGVYTYTYALVHADTPGDIRTINNTRNVSTVGGAYDKATVPTYPYAVAYEPNLTHRVGMIFTEAATSKDSTGAVIKNKDNATFDFVPSGAAVTVTRSIIDMTSCRDGCHSGTILHKGYNTNLCVTCHTETTFDPFTGGNPVTVDLKYMVHRIHMGETLPGNVQGIAIGGDPAVAPASYGINDFDTSDIAFPQQPVSNCLACHLSTATAGHSEATNWKTVPSRQACGACHDGINFATGAGSTLKDIKAWVTAKKVGLPATSGHAGGGRADDSACASCHDAGSTSLYHIK